MLLMQLCKCTKTAKKEKEKLPKSFHTLLVAVGSRKTKKNHLWFAQLSLHPIINRSMSNDVKDREHICNFVKRNITQFTQLNLP